MLFAKLKPSETADCFYSYDFDAAAARGLKGLILDIDNTLVPHGAPADERCRNCLEKLKRKGLKMVVLSNNSEARAGSFASAVGIPYLSGAGKPSPKGYRRALEILGLPKEEVLCAGDQLLTDIWGANNAGIRSMLVVPIDKSTDEIQIVLKRILEKIVVKKYLKKHSLIMKK